ncbi:hypothetical protein A1O3_08875 [Capronia epimyces CBS 606.96]|uniref:Uncharacterized protein n=1 Tax=Capronia epimyces CBS 606.96 TaxID=1182542 RepID=W9XGN9_9EURO|nr:uncharacterized protein A1O3_08875 [Capronia epimyces CBS 606.96]EXJ79373.1 hypothetical protein A1O3_08875 [Capronia epimyces CBS 606.96]
MAGLNALPTHRIHSTTRLSHREAHSFLTGFLERADIDAAYRPDSTLTERGPQAVSTGASPNLTLHHLKRILLGMEGKRVGGDLAGVGATDDGAEPENENENENTTATTTAATATAATRNKRGLEPTARDDGGAAAKKSKRKISNLAAEEGEDADADADAGPAAAVMAGSDADAEGWQDKDSFALTQTADNLEATAEDRHPGADLEQPADQAEEEEMMHVEVQGSAKKAKLSQQDKDERRRLKKLRNKEEKAQKAEKAKKKSKSKSKE